MNRLEENALRILETAEEVLLSGQEPSAVVILVAFDGTARMLFNSGWSLEALQAEHGGRTAYRVTRDSQGIRVECRKAGRSCAVETRIVQAVIASSSVAWIRNTRNVAISGPAASDSLANKGEMIPVSRRAAVFV